MHFIVWKHLKGKANISCAVLFYLYLFHSSRWVKESFLNGHITVVVCVSLCDPLNCVLWSTRAHLGLSIDRPCPRCSSRQTESEPPHQNWLARDLQVEEEEQCLVDCVLVSESLPLGVCTLSREKGDVQEVQALPTRRGPAGFYTLSAELEPSFWKGTELRVKGLLLGSWYMWGYSWLCSALYLAFFFHLYVFVLSGKLATVKLVVSNFHAE